MNPPTPTAVKIAFNNPGKRQLNRDEPTPQIGASVPEFLSDEGRAQWDRIAPMLERAGLLTEIDADALEMYCEAYARWRHANVQLARYGVVVKGGPGRPIQHSPYLSISNVAFDQMRHILGQFGMTPSSRTRVSKAPGARKKSRLAEAIGGGG